MSLVRRTGLIDRTVAVRDARLFLVATEDRYAGQQYFDALHHNGVIDARRVRIVVLPTEDTKSSPAAVLERLRATTVALEPMDERWLSLDRDRWTAAMLGEVCQQARTVGVNVAVSVPCFEAWLLLHLEDAAPPDTARACEARLRDILGGYNKARLPAAPWTRTALELARGTARRLDIRADDRWPAQPGSRLHLLFDAIQAARAIAPANR